MNTIGLRGFLSSLIGVGGLFLLPTGWLVHHHAQAPTPADPDQLTAIDHQVSPQFPANWARINQQQAIKIGTLIKPGFYLPDDLKTQGMDYDLAQRFAKAHNLDAEFIAFPSKDALFAALNAGEIHLAAAALIVDPKRMDDVYFSAPYLQVQPQWFWHNQSPEQAPTLTNLPQLAVAQGSYFDHWLVRQPLPKPRAIRFENSLDVLMAVNQGNVEAALLPSTMVLLGQKMAEQAQAGTQVEKQLPLAWALARPADPRLTRALDAFFAEQRQNGVFTQLIDRYFVQFERLDLALTHQFLQDIQQKLPRFKATFQQAADQYDLDWRLLAAMGYQESKWVPSAQSGQQAQGIMQIVPRTARSLGLDNPFDAQANIFAGARYIAQLREQMDEQTPEPDRTYLALAAYNVGIGHLRDALKLTEAQGGNPQRWPDVRERLPMMMEPEIYRDLQFGYARGTETYNYVENIRAFHDLMVWLEQRPATQDQPDAQLTTTRAD